jgi:hypothetical protein
MLTLLNSSWLIININTRIVIYYLCFVFSLLFEIDDLILGIVSLQ